jgi:hypothetical protein
MITSGIRELLRSALGAAVILSAIAIWRPALADELAGQVQIVVGAAQLIDASGKARPIERGIEVRQGDRVVTQEGALVQLKLTDGTFVAVRTNTDVAIEKYRYDDKSAPNSSLLLKLARGALRSITGLIGGSNPDGYKVITPTATIGIRGTDHEPVFIPEPKPGETPIGAPGTYDKVNSGATVILTQLGAVDIKPGQVGFVPITPGVVPKLLPVTPEFFKKLDPKGEGSRSGKQLGDQKFLARPMVKPELAGELKSATPVDTIKSETLLSPTASKTLSPALIESSSTLLVAPKLESATSTTLAPTTTLVAPTTTLIAPTTTLIAPTTTMIAPTTTLIAPTTTLVAPTTTTINPTLTPKTISPILLK